MSDSRPTLDCGEARPIPEEKRRHLRAEVNFGCPVPRCGIPYLTYHHFDPPYVVGKAHNVAGMIALCLAHHKQADAGTWTDERLREMKRSPFLSGDEVRGRLEWLRRDVLIYAGNNLVLNPGTLLQVAGERVIWTRRDAQGELCLNIHVRGDDGADVLHMEDNDWTVTGPIADLRASASANALRVQAPARGVTINIQFSSLTEETVRESCRRQARASVGQPSLSPDLVALLPPALVAQSTPTEADLFAEAWEPYARSGIRWPALYAAVSGRFRYPVPIRLTPSKLALPRGRVMSGNVIMLPGATVVDVLV